ncbi:uncharacterized protein LOC110022352 [Phalaenopsis equestris]|uniref:uncharacterized protein LOC110022352 n=1 Tax=Phalaenopsis equestris TaxID=78828 RepID=UPI0009E4AC12|nr:uncharacterized protein LOC110022352 [Phalaenopsis equestris]
MATVSDMILTGHIPFLEIPAAAVDGDEADDEKSFKTSPFSADDEDDDDAGSVKGRRSGIGGARRRRLWNRERKLDQAWEMKKSRAGFLDGESGECLVMVSARGSSGKRICMDMDEVKACRDLGLQIPGDFTVEIPGGLSGNSSGGDSPISGTGENAKEIKAKLKMWAHAVAFVSSAARSVE